MSSLSGPRRASLVAPVTALAFLTTSWGEVVLLVGEDTQLRVYDLEGKGLRWEVRVFGEQGLHGVHVQDGPGVERHVLVWGGSEVAVLSVCSIEEGLRLHEAGEAAVGTELLAVGRAPDWIHDGAISPVDGCSGVLATAHNEVVEVSWSAGGIAFGKVTSPSRPILYSANLRYLAPESVLVAGGTVFGEILVWKCNPGGGSSSCTMLHVFAGHEGSIFGVHLSDEISGENGEPTRLLASCSDDRTVRVWGVTDFTLESRPMGNGTPVPSVTEARETGFGDNNLPKEKNQRDGLVAMAIGHISRIWHVKFPPGIASIDSGLIPVYSFGEDSTAQLWNVQTAAKQLVHQETYANHDGKHIWSAAIARRKDGTLLVATGGADGKVSLIEERGNSLENGQYRQQTDAASMAAVSFETLSLLESGETGMKRGKGHDYLQRYNFVTNDSFLATTKFGKVLFGVFQPDLVWNEISVDETAKDDLRQCSAITRLGEGSALLGTNAQTLYLFHGGNISKLDPIPGKALFLLLLSREQDIVTALLTMHDNPDIRIYTIDLSSRTISSEITLQGIDPRFTLTAATLFHSFLLLGSRNGFISIFRAQSSTYTFCKEITPYAQDAITSITLLPGQDPSSGTVAFVTSNRDGKYRIYELDVSGPEIHSCLRHETPLPFGPHIEDAWFVKRGAEPSELILAGFRSKNLVVWNETRREVIMSVDCGGAHRVFAHTKDDVPERLRVAFTKTSKVYIHSQERPTCRTIKPGTHGREIRAIASVADDVKTPDGSTKQVRYIATGSEDTSIRIWEYSSLSLSPPPSSSSTSSSTPTSTPACNPTSATPSLKPRCAASIKVHTTGLQSLKWCTGTYLLSSGGNEDLFVFRVRKLAADFAGLAVFCEAAFRDKSADGDLRITDFDVRMSTEKEKQDFGCLIVTMGFSNSVVRMYRYTPPERRVRLDGSVRDEDGKGGRVEGDPFRLLVKGRYTGACITQVRHLGSSSVLTASTDGHLAIWNAQSGELVLQRVIKAHQSSIKAMALVSAHPSFSELPWLAVTAGDDNAVAFTAFDDTKREEEVTDERTVVRSAHAAAINGVVELGHGRFVTVSNDQRMKVWEVRPGGASTGSGQGARKLEVKLLRGVYSGVADAGPVEALTGGDIIVGGVGMEIWNMRLERDREGAYMEVSR